MKKLKRMIPMIMLLMMLAFGSTMVVCAAESETTAVQEEAQDSATAAKAVGAALVVGLVATGGALAMGLASSKSVESIARQPEAGGKIQTVFMLGLVFIETAIIYALIVAILIIFVM